MNSPFCRLIRVVAIISVLTFTAALSAQTPPAPAQAQPAPKQDPEREHALDLYHQGKFVEAMFALEKVAADHPSDAAVKESWAFSVMAYAATLDDPDLRKKARVRARNIALEAKQLGDTSNLLQVVLNLPPDGSEPSFSVSKEVDNIMKAAEADFSRGDFDKARDGYLHALLLEPKNYEAALFIGDVYFKQQIQGSAGEWFARAVEIDPNRETAYRYWGDALWAMGKSAEAREKYIQAIVADPYNNRCWVGLSQWAQRTKVTLNWVRLQDKSTVSQTDGKNINITLDNSLKKDDPNMLAWAAYGMTKATWRAVFPKEFPDEGKYRRTLKEESGCLTVMINVLQEQKDQEKLKGLDPAIQSLMKIQAAGFLDPFVLLNRADKDIVQDYAPYRTAHRDILYRYFDEFVVPKAPQ